MTNRIVSTTTEYAVRFSRTTTAAEPTDRWQFDDREAAEGFLAGMKSRGAIIAELQTRKVYKTDWEGES